MIAAAQGRLLGRACPGTPDPLALARSLRFPFPTGLKLGRVGFGSNAGLAGA
jgi:hypothetical protein